MKTFHRTAAYAALGAFLGGCKVYDSGLVSSKAQISSSTRSMRDGGGAGAMAGSQAGAAGNAAVRTNAADGGGGHAAPPARSPQRQPTTSDTDDSGVDAVDSSTRVVSPDEPDVRPAADGGAADAAASCDAANACSPGFKRRITLDGAQVAETLSDFPVLVRITDAHLQEHAATGGEDIYFTADDGVTLLDFEIESYSSTGELVAWVRVPSLTTGQDTTLFLGYGDGKTGRAKPTGVWSDFHYVWHMAEDPSGADPAIKDSTERAPGTTYGAMSSDARVSGVAGAALSFDGVDDEVTFVNDVWGSGPSTFSGWVKQQGSLGQYGTSMISLGGDTNADNSARFLLSHADEQKVKCGFLGNDDVTTAVLPLNQWKYVSWTWDGAASSVYVDGVRVLGPVSHTRVNTAGVNGKLGNTTFRFDYFMYGQLDELRVATTARSSAWITTEYANQRPGSSFIKALGEPEAVVQP